MNTGMTATVTARMTAENQSSHDDAAEQHDRCQRGQDQRRQVAGEVAVEGVDALGGRGGQLAGALPGQPRRPEGHGPGEQLAAQGGGDLGRRAVGGHLTGPGGGGPHGEGPPRATSAGTVRSRPSWSIRTSWTMAPSRAAWATSAAVPTSPTTTAPTR